MEQHRFVAWGLILSFLVAIIGGVFGYAQDFSNAMYTLAGFGYFIFGIWASVLLLQYKAE